MRSGSGLSGFKGMPHEIIKSYIRARLKKDGRKHTRDREGPGPERTRSMTKDLASSDTKALYHNPILFVHIWRINDTFFVQCLYDVRCHSKLLPIPPPPHPLPPLSISFSGNEESFILFHIYPSFRYVEHFKRS